MRTSKEIIAQMRAKYATDEPGADFRIITPLGDETGDHVPESRLIRIQILSDQARSLKTILEVISIYDILGLQRKEATTMGN